MTEPVTKVLVVDDEEAMRAVLELRLTEWGFEVVTAEDGAEARRLAGEFAPDLVISDVVLPDVRGHDLLRDLVAGDARRPVILITAHGDVEMAVEAMKEGAHDFLTKPLDYAKLEATIRAAERDARARSRSRELLSTLAEGSGFEEFVGSDPSMQRVYELIREVAPTEATVLITGESGTGKELAARAVQRLSGRAGGPFVIVNSAAIPAELMESEIFGHEKGAFTGAAALRRGCFELADGGTLFLDEISEMPAALQAKLLRVIEDGKVRRIGGDREIEVDVRILAATNRDPEKAVRDGVLREDLLYRLDVFRVELPALRERRDDLPLLVQHFITGFDARHGASVQAVRPEALRLLAGYDWPGNVRELRNVLERAVVLAKGEWIEVAHLPPYLRPREAEPSPAVVLPVGTTVAEAEKQLILKTLAETGGNKAEAARRLEIDVKTLRNKLRAWEQK